MGELKVYMMPDGVKRQFAEGEQPESAVLFEDKKPIERKPASKKKASK